MIDLIVQLPAEADIIVAHAWYSEQHEPLGEQFASALSHTINRVHLRFSIFIGIRQPGRTALATRRARGHRPTHD